MSEHVTHQELSDARETLRGEHRELSRKVDEGFVRLESKLTSGIRWIVGICLLLFSTTIGLVIANRGLVSDHITSYTGHKGHVDQKMLSMDEDIARLERTHEYHKTEGH